MFVKSLMRNSEKNNLGVLVVPNKNADCVENGQVMLKVLSSVLLNHIDSGSNIFGVYLYGDSVRDCEIKITKRRKFIFFGPFIDQTESEIISPKDIDILVFTSQLSEAQHVQPVHLSTEHHTVLKHFGWHVHFITPESYAKGLSEQNDLCLTSSRQGVFLTEDIVPGLPKIGNKNLKCNWSLDSLGAWNCEIIRQSI